MDKTTDWPDLAALAESYEIHGELYARPDARTFVGRRRADGKPVLVVLPRVPEGDERNALTLFAADVNLLSGLEHPALVPILESRWIDKNTFAVVTGRPDDATLEELLERGEEFPPARVAAILREVNGLLEWARTEKVVHRSVDLSTVYVDDASDDVHASFVVRPIPLSGAPTEEGDAHTIASLARAMLGGSARPLNENDETLAERRPDLPARVVERTEELLVARPGKIVPDDVRTYIAEVAMAEPIKAAEVEAERIKTERLEEQRAVRAELEAARAEHERMVADAERRIAEERERLERETAEERAKLEKEIARTREQLADEREKLLRDIERERADLAARRAELDRDVASARERFELERQELELQRAALDFDTSTVPIPTGAFPARERVVERPVTRDDVPVRGARAPLRREPPVAPASKTEETLPFARADDVRLARSHPPAAPRPDEEETLAAPPSREDERVVAPTDVVAADVLPPDVVAPVVESTDVAEPLVVVPPLSAAPDESLIAEPTHTSDVASEPAGEPLLPLASLTTGPSGPPFDRSSRSSRATWALPAAAAALVVIIVASAFGIGGRRSANAAHDSMAVASRFALGDSARIVDSAGGAVGTARSADRSMAPAPGIASSAAGAPAATPAVPSVPADSIARADSADSAAALAARKAAAARRRRAKQRADSIARADSMARAATDTGGFAEPVGPPLVAPAVSPSNPPTRPRPRDTTSTTGPRTSNDTARPRLTTPPRPDSTARPDSSAAGPRR